MSPHQSADASHNSASASHDLQNICLSPPSAEQATFQHNEEISRKPIAPAGDAATPGLEDGEPRSAAHSASQEGGTDAGAGTGGRCLKRSRRGSGRRLLAKLRSAASRKDWGGLAHPGRASPRRGPSASSGRDLLGGGGGGGASAQGAGGFAVIELFTSEGCSSCPPADALLRSMAHQLEHGGGGLPCPVVVLGHHVDYWDRLGWPDPFGSPGASRRQRRYARNLKCSTYTPQMVVNGTEEFIGSSEAHLRAALHRAARRSARRRVAVEELALALHDRTLRAGCRVAPRAALPDTVRVVYALTENALAAKVTSGGNAGRKLAHDAVVRTFEQMPMSADGSSNIVMQVPSACRRSKLRLVVLVQDEESGEIFAATSRHL